MTIPGGTVTSGLTALGDGTVVGAGYSSSETLIMSNSLAMIDAPSTTPTPVTAAAPAVQPDSSTPANDSAFMSLAGDGWTIV